MQSFISECWAKDFVAPPNPARFGRAELQQGTSRGQPSPWQQPPALPAPLQVPFASRHLYLVLSAPCGCANLGCFIINRAKGEMETPASPLAMRSAV